MGYFDKGKWIEEKPSPKSTDRMQDMQLEAHVKVHVDDSELRELKETLEGIRDIMSPPTTFWGRVRWLLFGNEI